MIETRGQGEIQRKNRLVIVASKGTADALYPALILATTAAAQNMKVDIYFTFGGMKLITKGMAEQIKPSVDLGIPSEQLHQLLQRGGMPSLMDMLKAAKTAGVKIHACSPTMSLFGMSEKDLVEVCDDVIGAATFLQYATDPEALTIFI
jgi:peroxiredoxin family protein